MILPLHTTRLKIKGDGDSSEQFYCRTLHKICDYFQQFEFVTLTKQAKNRLETARNLRYSLKKYVLHKRVCFYCNGPSCNDQVETVPMVSGGSGWKGLQRQAG